MKNIGMLGLGMLMGAGVLKTYEMIYKDRKKILHKMSDLGSTMSVKTS